MAKIVIVGNGIAGITAARHIRKRSDDEILVISSETEYFYSRTALMYIYMGHMQFEHTKPYEDWFWEKNRIDLKQACVNELDDSNKQVILDTGEKVAYDKLILATGSKSNKFGWPGQDLEGVLGLYNKQDLEVLETLAPDNKECKRAVIVGGGLIGIELAEMLRSRKIPVTFLVREKSFWSGVLPEGESKMLNEHILEHHIDLRLGCNLKEIRSDSSGKVKSIVIEEKSEEIECDVVGLTAGVSPNIDFLKSSNLETDKGILVNSYLETNLKDVYAIGDCAQKRENLGNRRPIEAVWYTGRIMGETVAQTICGNPIKYNPGHWFNSAKFFDIEYQTYGWVFSKPKEGNTHFHWRKDKRCITIEYEKSNNEFKGINTFGIRMRHELFDDWLNKKQSVHYVLEHLADANFDPEFFKLYEKEIVDAFNASNDTKVVLKKKSWKRIFAKR